MMRTGALIAAVLLAMVLCGCSSEQKEEVNTIIAEMETELVGMEDELAEVKAMVVDLNSELAGCKDEIQALMQDKLQEAEAAVGNALEEKPEIPEPPAEAPENPTGILE